jgi:hypothetical protein
MNKPEIYLEFYQVCDPCDTWNSCKQPNDLDHSHNYLNLGIQIPPPYDAILLLIE